MENIGNNIYIPIGQVSKKNYKKLGIKKFIKENRIVLLISGISISLLIAYSVLIINFINLIKILN